MSLADFKINGISPFNVQDADAPCSDRVFQNRVINHGVNCLQHKTLDGVGIQKLKAYQGGTHDIVCNLFHLFTRILLKGVSQIILRLPVAYVSSVTVQKGEMNADGQSKCIPFHKSG